MWSVQFVGSDVIKCIILHGILWKYLPISSDASYWPHYLTRFVKVSCNISDNVADTEGYASHLEGLWAWGMVYVSELSGKVVPVAIWVWSWRRKFELTFFSCVFPLPAMVILSMYNVALTCRNSSVNFLCNLNATYYDFIFR